LTLSVICYEGAAVPRSVLVLVAALALAPRGGAALELPVVEETLPNGLRVLVHEDHSAPVVSSYIFFRSGSRNETCGQTGIAHLFEHMMFNGGKKFGPGMFDDLIEGTAARRTASRCATALAYLNNFPREALPIVLDLESDRMAHLALTPQNLEQERGIVMEERRLRIDDQVSGAMNESLYLHAYERSPYRWNTIGFMEDLRKITLDQARAYFRTYYAPNNATLVLGRRPRSPARRSRSCGSTSPASGAGRRRRPSTRTSRRRTASAASSCGRTRSCRGPRRLPRRRGARRGPAGARRARARDLGRGEHASLRRPRARARGRDRGPGEQRLGHRPRALLGSTRRRVRARPRPTSSAASTPWSTGSPASPSRRTSCGRRRTCCAPSSSAA
jgi:hypothetical protein